jgi:adenosyl cobinamide kinase/adenosyl cobinamide phosphate guanylyltransferase
MELYIGGYAQGKLRYVTEKYAKLQCVRIGWQESTAALPKAEVYLVTDFHLRCREAYVQGKTTEDIWNEISKIPEKLVIIGNEIGNGIVPVEQQERYYRENYGRLLCEIAAKATHVERIFCGIGQVIKECK